MTGRYKNEMEIEHLAARFENAALSRDEWKHAEHLVVAMHYLLSNDLETATAKMRSGIFNLLEKGFGVDLSKEMPYHETLTVFWMRTVFGFLLTTDCRTVVDKANELINLFDKDYPLRFYSRELLFSDEARARFVDADLEPAFAAVQ